MTSGATNAAVVPAHAGAKERLATGDPGIVLTYGSLHDLVGPANQVCSLAGLLLKQYGDRIGPEAEAVFDLIQGSVTRLQNLLAGVRAYAQIVGRQMPFEHADANALLAGAISSIKEMIEEAEAQVTSDDLPEVYGDRGQISYLLTSLVENAVKFRAEARPEIHVAANLTDGMWVFSVRDNGIGVDPKYHTRIFELFKRVHNEKYPGAGVGLAVADRIVQRHGGKIWAESEIGRGATFYFSLPRHRPAGSPNAVD